MTSTASKPLRADAARNRARVLDAARACFARDGIDAQMDDIAAHAEVGVGTVYRHFATKEALIEALAEEHFRQETEVVRAALELADPWEAFTSFIRNGAAVMSDNRALAQVASERPDVMQNAAIQADVQWGFFGMTDSLIRRAQEAGALRGDFELEDVPAIMCSLGSLQHSRGAYANWQRVMEFVIEGLRSPATTELPGVAERLPRVSGAV
jgi:AcrR family transcriptional regulator